MPKQKNNFLEEEKIEQSITLPRHRHWGILVLIILVAAIAVGSWLYWDKQQSAIVTNFAECSAAGGAILESYPEQCSINGQSYTNPDQVAPNPPTNDEVSEPQTPEPKLASYTDIINKFSIQYPDDLVQSDKEIPTPYTNSAIPVPAKLFSHSIPIQYCNLKGDCVPNTTDFSISFSVVNSTLATIGQSKIKDELVDFQAGENKFKSFSQGAEGEGIYYYFMSLPSGKTLMITRTYFDETVLTAYKGAKNFISKADQEKLASQILMSLTLETN